jgi:hypothetical protein
MDGLDSADVARVVGYMDAVAAAKAHPIAIADAAHCCFPS